MKEIQDWFVYLLRCADGSLYAGITTDLERRCAEHNSGEGARYTRGRTPVEIVYSEPCDNRSSASRRERQLKALPRRQKLALVSEFFHASRVLLSDD